MYAQIAGVLRDGRYKICVKIKGEEVKLLYSIRGNGNEDWKYQHTCNGSVSID